MVWGLIVWVFGEAFGGIFAPGLTWLFGAPGAVLIYAAAGALLALPDRSWQTPKLGRAMLAGFGLFLVGMAVLQAWPGRGFWQGDVGRPARHPDRHGPVDGRDVAAAVPVQPGVRLRARWSAATASPSTWSPWSRWRLSAPRS